MAIDPNILTHLTRHLRMRVLSGLEKYSKILGAIPQVVEDELGHGDTELQTTLVKSTEALILETRAAERTWTEPTTNDAIDLAFAELDAKGIIALQNAGFTISDGWSDVAEEARHRPSAYGAVFYHAQDLERAVDGRGLYLAFGAFVEGERHDAESIAVGREICARLEKHRVALEWDGKVKSRVRVLPFEWRRRLRPR